MSISSKILMTSNKANEKGMIIGADLPLWDWARRVEIETTFEYTQSCVKLVTPLSIEDTAGT
jgi:hypothetical protein